ncbi:MAG: hypothetical protein SGJ00_14240 [bacterium]|nr:hypothetical protein [bacterium]
MECKRPRLVKSTTLRNNKKEKWVEVELMLPSFSQVKLLYKLNREKGQLICEYELNKYIERGKTSMHIAVCLKLVQPQMKTPNKWLKYG